MDIIKIKEAIANIERLECELANKRAELAAEVGADNPIEKAKRGRSAETNQAPAVAPVGKRKVREPARTKAPRRPARVADESVELVAANLTSSPLDSDTIGEGTELRKPTVLGALKQLVAAGRAVKTGDKRGARWAKA